ncbi:MAG: 2,3-bisphosphoglycerate-independent phosphoglycerate mutase, partial [Gammaproteobacteria bacterium]|nr:2,3-bisphosphoglycerate-independent phosphoglycerate mutase [Gammaproteobacteria bacterium]
GHVTYFWNGNRSGKFRDELETYVEIPSDNCPFDQRPWMKSAETTDQAIAALQSGRYRFLRFNYAGGDMVGHTGNIAAATLAVESIDLGLARLVRAARQTKACLVVSADHGNADDMVQRDKQGNPVLEGNKPVLKTSHTLNPVPFIIADFADARHQLRSDLPEAGLGNVASTLLELLGYRAPEAYDPSLIVTD